MKIGLLHNLYGEFSHGGAETAVAVMAAEYRRQGHDVFLVTTRPRRSGPAAQNPAADVTGLKIYELPSDFYDLNRRPWLYRAAWQMANLISVRKYFQIKSILAAEKPDLAVTHNLMGLGFLTPLALRRLKIRHEHFLHDIQLLHPSGLMLWGGEQKIDSAYALAYQALTRSLFAAPARVVSPSRWLLDLHSRRAFFPDSDKIVRPLAWPVPTSQRQPLSGGAKHFLFIGQIEEQKGIFLLISAFKKINGTDLKLAIAIRGGGRDLAAAQTAAAGDGRIRFLGPVSYEETEQIKAASDCLIVPSLCYENSPTVIYGAHAAGLKVIASDIGGIPEIIGTDGLLFRPGDEADLIAKIKLTI